MQEQTIVKASKHGVKAAALLTGHPRSSLQVTQATEGLREYLVRAFKPDLLALKLAELVGQKRVATFVMDKVMGQAEIERICEELQAEFMGARRIGGGKMLVYYLANESDTQLRALDMIMKLHGAYAPERHEIVAGRALSGMSDEQLEAAIAEGRKVFSKGDAVQVEATPIREVVEQET